MKDFLKYAGIRAAKTFCQSILAMIPLGISLEDVSWGAVLGTSALAAILSVCTSIVTGLPEMPEKEKKNV